MTRVPPYSGASLPVSPPSSPDPFPVVDGAHDAITSDSTIRQVTPSQTIFFDIDFSFLNVYSAPGRVFFGKRLSSYGVYPLLLCAPRLVSRQSSRGAKKDEGTITIIIVEKSLKSYKINGQNITELLHFRGGSHPQRTSRLVKSCPVLDTGETEKDSWCGL